VDTGGQYHSVVRCGPGFSSGMNGEEPKTKPPKNNNNNSLNTMAWDRPDRR
jgi:hypothetical protein